MTALIRRMHRLQRELSPQARVPVPLPQPSESKALARRMAADLKAEVEDYLRGFGWTPEKAIEEAKKFAPGTEEDAWNEAPEKLTPVQLRALLSKSPEAALAKWEQLLEAARDHRHSGEHAWEAVAPPMVSLWSMAKFMALRRELTADWQPRNGVEQMLLDQVLQLQTLIEMWQGELMSRMMVSNVSTRREPDQPPRVDDVQAIEQAMHAIDRLYAIKLRTLNSLQRMRGGATRVVVRRARQVNVADQQVNITAGE